MEIWKEDLSHLWDKLYKYYEIAEKFIKILETKIKEVEQQNDEIINSTNIVSKNKNGFEYDGVLFPPINQLRYACRDLLTGYYKNPNTEIGVDRIKEAIRHAKRAAWDSIEIAMWIKLKEIEIFKGHYKDYITKELYPNWGKEYVEPIQEIYDFIDRNEDVDRKHRANYDVDPDGISKREIPEETIDKADKYYDQLTQILNNLETHRPVLNSMIRKDNKTNMNTLVSGAILGAVIGYILSNLQVIFEWIF